MTNANLEQKATELIKEVISDFDKKQFMWQDISGALAVLSQEWTAERENLFASLLKFEGTVQLLPESDITGRMAPQDILKSVAIKNLTEWKGKEYLSAFEKLKATTESEAIAEVAQIHIEKIQTQQQTPQKIINMILKALSRFLNTFLRIIRNLKR